MNDLTRLEDVNPLAANDTGNALTVHNAAQVNAQTQFITGMLRAPIARERSLEKVERRLREMANLLGDDLYYSYPVKNRKTGKTSEVIGPSIKLAMMLVEAYGNAGYNVEVVETENSQGTPVWVFKATFVDRETGNVHTRMFQQRKTAGTMGDDDDRREDMAFQIGQSKAIRNVVVHALRSYAEFAVQLAKDAIIAKIDKAPVKFREQAVERIEQRGVPIERVSAWIGAGPLHWKAKDTARVIAALQAINEGAVSVDDIWPAEKGEIPSPPPPPSAAKPAAKSKPAAAKGKAPAGDGPPTDPDAFAGWIIKQFGAAPDAATLDTVWERHEKAIAESKRNAEIVAAYDERRTAIGGE